MPKDKEISEEIILLRRMVQMMSQQNAVDAGSRQRISVDAFLPGVALPNVTNVATVSTVTTVSTVSAVSTVSTLNNLAAVAGEGVRMYEVPARNCYSNSIRNKLTFA